MNARQELFRFLEDHNLQHTDIEAAALTYGRGYLGPKKQMHLPKGHTPEQWQAFALALDFGYDNGYGGQELFGTIWFHGGTWAERGEYDGSEWWEYRQRPSIPSDLQGEKQ